MNNNYDFREIEQRWQVYWETQNTYRCEDESTRPKFYVLEMFPYPSGIGLHAGHLRNYVPTDTFCRYKAMRGFNVLYPMGWDAFGQPAENEAIKRQRDPKEMVEEYSDNFRRAMQRLGLSYDWSREINTSSPEYYKWTQWFFLLLYERGLAYRATASINWCSSCKTGLANEEVKEARCWRCDTSISKRPMPQWYFRITDYADRLLNDLTEIDWPEGVKLMQREWIGRSEGAEIDFPLESGHGAIKIFTTRPDTIFGATFMVLAPEHPLVEEITTDEHQSKINVYRQQCQRETEIQRSSADHSITGAFTGAYAINPVSGMRLEIWISDYVLMGYGSGAIMSVPAHDQRDFNFARKFNLPIELVYQDSEAPITAEKMTCALTEGGIAINAGPFSGRASSKETVSQFTNWLVQTGKGKAKISYKLRDWLISRQRFWGTPIPIIHCPQCGQQPVPVADLPVLLPEIKNIEPTGTGESPLASITEFVNTNCPRCGGDARRETDTMGGFACSSWYFMRFADPKNDEEFANRQKLDYWLPVNLYTGGTEHAVMHLLYARFWVKVLSDADMIGFNEPFRQLRNQGMLLGYTPGRRPRPDEQREVDDSEQVLDWIVLKPEERESYPADQIIWRWAKMSKSKGNGIDPEKLIDQVGADSVRLYMLFVGPFEDDARWSEEGLIGAHRFNHRLWRWIAAAIPFYDPNWESKLIWTDSTPVERKVRRKLHQTVRKVGIDLENFSFNTSVAAIMELLNELYAYAPADEKAMQLINSAIISENLDMIVPLLSPLMPHLADEFWRLLGKSGSLYGTKWPEYDEAAIVDDEFTLVVQVNGKLKDRIVVSADATEETLKTLAVNSKHVTSVLNENRRIKKVILVPKKLVNVVIG